MGRLKPVSAPRNPRVRVVGRATKGLPWHGNTQKQARVDVQRASVQSLPVEVLNIIFHEAILLMGLPLHYPGYIYSDPGWLSLLWICAQWRNIIIADAAVWANCYSHYPKLQATFLERARQVPLSYILTGSQPRISPVSGMFRSDEIMLSHFLAATPLDRCAEIYVSDGRGNDIVDYIFELAALSTDEPLRHLQHLHLETWHWGWNGPKADLLTKGLDRFAITSEKLEEVHFQNCWTVISSPVLRRLKIVFSTSYLTRPSIHVFYHSMTLLSGSALTHLELTNPVGGSYHTDVRGYQADPIILPSLTNLALVGYAPHIANVLRIISWPRHGTTLRVRAVVGDGPAQSLIDQQEILQLCYPYTTRGEVRAVAIGHESHRHLADRVFVRFWSADWSGDEGAPPAADTIVSFGGAYMPCMWYETAMSAVQACGNGGIRLLVLALLSDDYTSGVVPWEQLFATIPSLAVLFPWKQVMDSIGPVDDDHALGSGFRGRVQDFDTL